MDHGITYEQHGWSVKKVLKHENFQILGPYAHGHLQTINSCMVFKHSCQNHFTKKLNFLKTTSMNILAVYGFSYDPYNPFILFKFQIQLL